MKTTFAVCIPSYKRAGKVTTHKLFPPGVAKIVVCESQAAAYRKHYGSAVVTIPDSEDGSPPKKRNAILNRYPVVLMMDDDVSTVGMYEDGNRINYTGDMLMRIVSRYFDLAAQIGVTLWGINQNNDALIYDTYRPFNFLSPVLGPFTGHIRPVVRYDELIKTKEDIEFWLHTIYQHHKTLRVNKMYYNHGHSTNAGGATSMRTMASEDYDMAYLHKKYGADIVQFGGGKGGGRFGNDTLNYTVQIPIPGI